MLKPVGKAAGRFNRVKQRITSTFCALATVVLVLSPVFSPVRVTADSVADLPDWEASHPIIVQSPDVDAESFSGYTPAQIRKAYGLDGVSGTGMGQVIAIVVAYGSPTIAADLDTFNAAFGLPPASLTIHAMGSLTTNPGWAVETALDVEWAHAMAPDASILLVEAVSARGADLLAAVEYATNYPAQIVSMSWGGREFAGESGVDSYFNHAGVTYVASSGDDGAGVSWPAVSPYVVGVGGTTLTTLPDGTYTSEVAWSGSGGGTSAYVAKPAYQNGFQAGSKRGVPDVAFDADPRSGVRVYDSTGVHGWAVVGGTSLSAPCWAGIFAVLGQSGPSWLYSKASPASAYAVDYNDITSGSNGLPARSGYDLVTGLGTPKVISLDASLTVTSPVGGEQWTADSAHDITWTSFGLTGTVKIELSRDSGSTWSTIVASTQVADGSKSWTVSGPATRHALVRVSSNSVPSVKGSSDADFTVVGHGITLDRPGGGEAWMIGNLQTVSWMHSDDITGMVGIDISRDGGVTWSNIVSSVEVGDGSVDWTVAGPTTSHARIRISNATSSSVSLSDFRIIPQHPWVAYYNGKANDIDVATGVATDGIGDVYVTGISTNSSGFRSYATIKYDASGNQLWIDKYDTGVGDSEANAIVVDALGNAYVTGRSFGADTSSDYATIKYGPQGNRIWVARYNGSGTGSDEAVALAVDGSGNVYVTGSSWGDVTQKSDILTVGYDSNGNQLWAARYNGSGNYYDYAKAIALDSAGNAYVTGSAARDGTGRTYCTTIKYDGAGNQVWASLYSNPADVTDSGKDVALDGSGNVYVTGTGSYVFFTIKYDTNGSELWASRYNCGNGGVEALALDGSGNVYVAGEGFAGAAGWDWVTVKYDPDGNQIWNSSLNGPGNGDDRVGQIAVHESGDVYVCGYLFAGSAGNDFAVAKYDSSGDLSWEYTYDGAGHGYDWASAAALDGFENVSVTGFCTGSGSNSDFVTVHLPETGPIPPDIWVLSPGSERWSIGSSHDISWDSYDVAGSVNIDLSRDSGTTWSRIASSVSVTDAKKVWTVTGPVTENAVVKISSASSAFIYGSSDFAITSPPVVSTSAATSVARTSATLNGSVTTLGSASTVAVSFLWGTSQASLSNEIEAATLTTASSYSADLAGLIPGTTYYFRAKAVGDGTVFGAVMNFKFQPKAPVVSSKPATGITRTTATLNGNIGNLGTASSLNVSFIWGTSPTALTNETAPVSVGTTGAFSANLSSLTTGTTYYYKAKAAGDMTAYGAVMNFKFLAKAPVVSSKPATGIARTTATLNGNLTGLGSANPVTVSFVWGTSPTALTNETAPVGVGTTGTFSANLSSLTAGTMYYFKAKAVGDGTVYGVSTSFKFLAKAPVVSSKPATGITRTVATLNGNLTGLGSANPVTVSFVWGTSPTALTNETSPVGVGTTGAFSAGLSSLTPGTTYYYKAKASGDGTVYGVMTTLKTIP